MTQLRTRRSDDSKLLRSQSRYLVSQLSNQAQSALSGFSVDNLYQQAGNEPERVVIRERPVPAGGTRTLIEAADPGAVLE